MITFIDEHRGRFGVEPICRVLTDHGCTIVARTYRANKARPASARSLSDALLLVEIVRVHAAARGRLYGARKVHAQLRREGIVAARCTVERLMRSAGLQGVRRDKTVRTTFPDKGAPRPHDLVAQEFTAPAPNTLSGSRTSPNG